VPEVRAAVTDTHPLLFHASGRPSLGRRAARLFAAVEARTAVLYVPAAVMWETALLVRVGRVDLRRSLRDFYADLFSNPAYQPLDLTSEQVYAAEEERPNEDPFDALICAAARHLSLPLITRDADIMDWGRVRVLW
jgi:PIN domain nuclease of toxin-antitoxin system